MNAIEIINTIRDNNSQMYQDYVPELTRENMQQVGNAITTYEATMNEFCDALVNRIGLVEVSSRRYKNPLAVLKSGTKPFGTDIEEIYVNPATGETYDGSEVGDMLTIKKPDVKTIFHRMNRQDKYKVSITIAMVQKAFTNEGELSSFIIGVINSMYSGDEIAEFLLMRNVFSQAIADKKLKAVTLDYDYGETTSKDLIKLVKTISSDMSFPDTQFNGYNELNATGIEGGTITPCTTWTPTENQVFFVRSDVDAATDVEVLAKAFNMDKTDFLKRKFVVNSFGDKNTLCVVADEKVMKVKDDFYGVRSFENGSNLARNYWLHHWQTISLSLFANAVAIQSTAQN